MVFRRVILSYTFLYKIVTISLKNASAGVSSSSRRSTETQYVLVREPVTNDGVTRHKLQ